MPPTIPDMMISLTWFASTLRWARDNPAATLPTPPVEHIRRLDAAINLLGRLHISPGAQIVLSELGYSANLSLAGAQSEPRQPSRDGDGLMPSGTNHTPDRDAMPFRTAGENIENDKDQATANQR